MTPQELKDALLDWTERESPHNRKLSQDEKRDLKMLGALVRFILDWDNADMGGD